MHSTTNQLQAEAKPRTIPSLIADNKFVEGTSSMPRPMEVEYLVPELDSQEPTTAPSLSRMFT